ncbi:unnamed protein product [Bemisia tabaci]|uniref:RRM domain-containing protein n=1 Tax=Bemisia tabaci TaxID=7038 RepID=A0A9P0AML1_BEMTA|nr:unnamed protein product [Bemisia tabaci]
MADSDPVENDEIPSAMEVEEPSEAAESDSSNNSADSSDEDDGEDEKLESLVTELESSVASNVFNYNAHLELINACGKLGDLDKLRSAREQMSKYFPLTPELWLAWLRDEIKLASTDQESEKLFSLFERAVEDYLSIELWGEYIHFSIGKMGSENGEEKVREIAERALTAGGLHVAKGVLLWEAYREFEKVILALLEQKALQSNSTQFEDAVLAQKRKIGSIFQRQLAVPLMDMETTYTEFKTWLNEVGDTNIVDIKAVEHGYKKALQKLSRILTFEEAVLCAEPVSRLGVYQQYLAYEQNPREGGNDPGRVQCLYERVITDHCLESQLWLDYINYAVSTIKLKEVVLKLLQRAVRNCPWCAEIWLIYIKQQERYKEPIDSVTGVLEQALVAGFSSSNDYRAVWLEYILYLRRTYDEKSPEEQSAFEEKIRTTIERAYEHLVQMFGTEGDPDCELLLFWAKWEAVKPNRSMEKVRQIYNDILTICKTKSSLWSQCLTIERYYGDEKHLRRLFARALATDTDWPEGIGTLWLDYEKLHGSLEQYEHCLSKVNERLKQERLKQEKLLAANTENKQKSGNDRSKKGKKEKAEKNVKKEMNEDSEVQSSSSKGKWEHLGAKRQHEPESQKDGVFKVPSTDGPPSEKKPKLEDFGAVEQHDAQKNSRMVFISNLDYSVTEEEIKNCITKLGFPIQELRLVKDFQGRSKGYCYVVLESELEAQGLLKKDREKINNRPMFISRCDPDKVGRSKAFKFSTDLEKNKLFIKGIPVNINEEELTNIFKEYGNLKELRLATYRNGHSKGIAYAEYQDEESAKLALIKADRSKIGGQEISVAFSKPPERRNQTSLIPSSAPQPVQSLGGGPRNYGSRGKSRTQIMLPRALQLTVPGSTSTTVSNGNGTPAPATNGDSTPKPSGTALSNSDFRNLLLGKK